MELDALHQTMPRVAQVPFDNASLLVGETPLVDSSGELVPAYFAQFQRFPELADAAAITAQLRSMIARLRTLVQETASLYQSTTTLSTFGTTPVADEETVIDERLPCPPLDVRSVKLTFRYAGRGSPSFRVATEVSLYDDQ